MAGGGAARCPWAASSAAPSASVGPLAHQASANVPQLVANAEDHTVAPTTTQGRTA